MAAPAPIEPASDRLLACLMEALDAGKAEDVITLDLRGYSTLGEHMIIASAGSARHIAALAARAIVAAKQAGAQPGGEGVRSGDWALVDAGAVIVHIFRPEVRIYYDLETLWGKGGAIDTKRGASAG